MLMTSQQAHVNLWLVMFLGMHLESASKQWGTTSSFAIYKSITFSYPISCSTCYVASATTGSTGETALQITNIGVSSCTIYRHYTGNSGGSGIAYVIVIGKAQQWGQFSESPYTFPISFSSACYAIIVRHNNNSETHTLLDHWYMTTSITEITRAIYSLQRQYIAIGK